MIRKCKDCPPRTKSACLYAFGVYWCVKSSDGEGCNHPLDDVADSWRQTAPRPPAQKISQVETPRPVQREFDFTAAATPPPLSDDDY